MIITTEDIRAIRPIAENVNDVKRLVPYIEECEMLYLIKAIGEVIYQDIVNNRSNHELLLNGGYYDNSTKIVAGIKKAMGYLVYSRFVRNQNVNATAFGIVAKQGQFSEAVDEKTIIRISSDAEKIGIEYLNQCVDYLKFLDENNQTVKKVVRKRFTSIGD